MFWKTIFTTFTRFDTVGQTKNAWCCPAADQVVWGVWDALHSCNDGSCCPLLSILLHIDQVSVPSCTSSHHCLVWNMECSTLILIFDYWAVCGVCWSAPVECILACTVWVTWLLVLSSLSSSSLLSSPLFTWQMSSSPLTPGPPSPPSSSPSPLSSSSPALLVTSGQHQQLLQWMCWDATRVLY